MDTAETNTCVGTGYTNCLRLRLRLQIYIAVLVFVLLACLCALVVSMDIFPLPKETVRKELEKGLTDYKQRLHVYFENTAAHGIRFSETAAQEIGKFLRNENISFSDLANNQKLIEKLQNRTYNLLYQNMVLADCSGAFIIFDTTVNTSLPDAENSRSGMYLKLLNLRMPTPTHQEMAWVRGIAHIGTQHNHFFHNKWELEFSIKNIPFYKKFKARPSPHLEESFIYSHKIKLPGTWESMVLLCVPMVGSDGEFYGICGLEISTMYFKLAHPVGNGDN